MKIRAESLRPLAAQSEPLIYLTASREKEVIATHLRSAGFAIAERVGDTPYVLRVTLGIPHGWKSCGAMSGVKFDLRRKKRSLVLVSDRGWTGTCQPNVLRGASERLMQELRAIAPRDEEVSE